MKARLGEFASGTDLRLGGGPDEEVGEIDTPLLLETREAATPAAEPDVTAAKRAVAAAKPLPPTQVGAYTS